MQNCFVPADILLPGAATPLDPWACIAVDQFTSQPEYWQKAEELAKGKPSTLHIVLPEAYLGTPQEESRLAAIRAAMQDYRDNLLTRCVHGYVYVERTQMDGTIRQGLESRNRAAYRDLFLVRRYIQSFAKPYFPAD